MGSRGHSPDAQQATQRLGRAYPALFGDMILPPSLRARQPSPNLRFLNETKQIFAVADFLSRPLTNIQRSVRALREAGTLPRSPRIKWGAGTPDAPLTPGRCLPAPKATMRMNARARARVYASSSDAKQLWHKRALRS
jgi:hypothetical protein